MSVINGLFLAFAMYSKIPMPKVEWNEKNMKYVLCFFPWIGIVIGTGIYLLWISCRQNYFTISYSVFALVSCIFPILITGGIHLDGYMDTMDALHSYQPIEKKLEILKDPHIGAFAGISLACYLALYTAALFMIRNKEQILLLGIGFFLSRTFSGLSLVTMKSAKEDGLLYTFASRAHKRIVLFVLILWLLVGMAACFFVSGVRGILCALLSSAVFFYYKYMSQREFGGLTGDLAGWFLTVYELVFAWSIAISEVVRFFPY